MKKILLVMAIFSTLSFVTPEAKAQSGWISFNWYAYQGNFHNISCSYCYWNGYGYARNCSQPVWFPQYGCRVGYYWEYGGWVAYNECRTWWTYRWNRWTQWCR